MGAVKVKVLLTNGVDEALVRSGQLLSEDIRRFEGEALVDTGAVKCIVPKAVMEQLGLTSVGKRPVKYADGRTELVEKIGPITVHIQDRESNEDAYVLGDEILIGQTALESMDLRVDCLNQTLIQNPEHPNGPVFRV
jgi:clan AA aspartic protease